MANSLLTAATNAFYAQSTTTSFPALGEGFIALETTETNSQIVHRTAGVLSKMTMNVTTFTSATVITPRKNASAAGINETLTVGGTGLSTDSTHTDSVTAGDKWNYTCSNLASTFSLFSNVFAATTNTACRLFSTLLAGDTVTATATNYYTLGGKQTGPGNVPANGEITIEKAGTFTNLCVNVTSAATTGVVRTVQGATPTIGNCTVNVTSTGFIEDTSHTDSPTAGQLWGMQANITSGTVTMFAIAVDYTTTTGDSIQMAGNSGGRTIAKSSTANTSVGGDSNLSTTPTEAQVQNTTQNAFVYSNTGTECQTAVGTTDTLQLRANSAQAGSIQVTVNATGNVLDTTHTYTAATGDNMDFQLVTSATTGTRTYNSFWTHANLATAVAAIIYPNFFTTKAPQQMITPRFYPNPSNLPPMFVA